MEGKFLSPCISENVFILPEHLFDNSSGYKNSKLKMIVLQKFESILCLLVPRVIERKFEAILICSLSVGMFSSLCLYKHAAFTLFFFFLQWFKFHYCLP